MKIRRLSRTIILVLWMAGILIGSQPEIACASNPSGVGAATPNAVFPGDPTLLTMAVTAGTSPPSTGLGVKCDLTSIGGSAAQTFYDDGTNGDVTAGDNIFSYSATVAGNTTSGTKSLTCAIADAESRSGSATIALTVVPAILPIGTVNGPVGDADNGTTHVSPYVNQFVTIQGVIYEKTLQTISNSTNTYKGFYIQNTSATADTDPNTSDGLFVFMNINSTIPGPGGPYTPTVGDEVIIFGKVSEYYNMTEVTGPILVDPVRSGVNLEAELPPVVVNPPANLADANRYWERLQGMRVQIPMNSIVLNGRDVFTPADAEIWVARSDSTIALRANPYERRAFRDAHPLDDNYDPNNWDGNGYRILMGSLGIKAAANDAQALITPTRTFDTVTNAPIGAVNYTFSKYRIEITVQPIVSVGVDPAANNPPQTFDRNFAYSIMDYNLENLYDYRDNPFSGCDFEGNSGCPKVAPFLSAITPPFDYVPPNDAAYQALLTDIAHQIINDLHSPDILMAQEVENQDICTVTGSALTCGTTDNADGKPDVLQELALKIASLGGPAYDASWDRDSSDLRGITPAFLFRTDRVELLPPAGDPILGSSPSIDGYTAVPYNSDVSNPKSLNAELPAGIAACETNWVFPRAPSIGLFRIYRTAIGIGDHRDVYVINNHFKSGPDTCVLHRTEQAKFNAALVAFIQGGNPNARIVVGGDLNVYPRPDDPFTPIGQPGSSDQLGSLYDPNLGLKNLWEVLIGQAPEAAYSYVYLGMGQTLDQEFVNQPMLEDLYQFRVAHINSDFPTDYVSDVARATSHHDPNVAVFKFTNKLSGKKFYDGNANGTYDPQELGIGGWPIALKGEGIALSTFTDSDGSYTFTDLTEGDYTLCEGQPDEKNWMQTAPGEACYTVHVPYNDPSNLNFGNLCLGTGGALSAGFWSNKNGKMAFLGNDNGLSARAMLVGLNLRTGMGLDFNPATYTQFKNWIVGRNAVNMAYMLSAQLAAMELNILRGYVNGNALIYAPGTNSANNLGFAPVLAIAAEADAELGFHGYTVAGSEFRAYQEKLENALDNANNNLSFVQSQPCAHSFFVKRDGFDLRFNGAPFRFAGANNYYLMYQSQFMVDDVLTTAAANLFTAIRMWGSLEIGNQDGTDSTSGKANGVYFQYWGGSAPAYNDGDDGLRHLDYVIHKAGQLGLRLVIPLVNNWSAFGGMDQYVLWREGEYHDQFYTDPVIRQWYKNWISHLLNRTNVYTGIQYKNDPTIMAWELANEPRCVGSGLYPRSPTCTPQTLIAWADEMSRFLKIVDPNHLVSVGDEGFYCIPGASDWTENCGEGVDTIAFAKLNNIDLMSFHLYPDFWGKDAAWGTQWINRHIADAHAIPKPVMLGEFGWMEKNTRNSVYEAWTNAVLSEGGNGALFWLLSGRQDDGTYYPDYDGLTVYCPSEVCTTLSNFSKMMSGN